MANMETILDRERAELIAIHGRAQVGQIRRGEDGLRARLIRRDLAADTLAPTELRAYADSVIAELRAVGE